MLQSSLEILASMIDLCRHINDHQLQHPQISHCICLQDAVLAVCHMDCKQQAKIIQDLPLLSICFSKLFYSEVDIELQHITFLASVTHFA